MTRMPGRPVNDKKWLRDVLAHRDTGAVPYLYSFSPPVLAALKEHYTTDSVEDAVNFPIRMSGTVSVKPLYANPDEFGDTAADEYGVVWSTTYIDRGSPTGPCLAEPDLSGYEFPTASAPYRFELIPDWCEKNRDHFTIIWVGDLWERATFMRGMENILLDVALNRKFVEELLEGITDYVLETMKILFETASFDGIAVSDDYGAQNGTIISPDDWRGLIKPHLKRIYSFARDHDRTVFHHTCGHVTPIVGDMIDIGLDILHPIQPEAMDIFHLKKEFGSDVTLCGGVRTQDLLPRGTPDEVRSEVRRLKETMGKGGGYILGPGITLQADIPLENIVAMLEEVARA